MGTPLYMAPELARGAREAGPRADIFSFGVLAYELLANQYRSPHHRYSSSSTDARSNRRSHSPRQGLISLRHCATSSIAAWRTRQPPAHRPTISLRHSSDSRDERRRNRFADSRRRCRAADGSPARFSLAILIAASGRGDVARARTVAEPFEGTYPITPTGSS